MPAGVVVPRVHVTSRSRGQLLGLALLLLLGFLASAGAATPVYDIPHLDGIVIDGKAADWGDRGFAVRALVNSDGALKTAADLDAVVRLGWNEQGLLVLVQVRDNVAVENASVDNLYQGDAVEVFIASDTGRAAVALQSITAPGRDPKTPELRRKFFDGRSQPKDPFVATFARVVTPDGYALEALYPWSGLGMIQKASEQFRFGLWVDDSDVAGSTSQVAWMPMTSPEVDSRATHVLRLADRPSPPVLAAVAGSYERMRRVAVTVAADGAMAGHRVTLLGDGKALLKAKLEGADGKATAKLGLPLPAPGQKLPALSVAIEGGGTYPLELPDLAQARARAVLDLPFNAHPAVFSGAGFPALDFDQPNLAEDILGRYTVRTTYYDANYAVVTAAERPGRYGAVVTVMPEYGRALFHFRTLFRQPEGMRWDYFPRQPQVRAELPMLPGLDASVLKANAVAINDVMQSSLMESVDRSQGAAILLAGMYGAAPSAQPVTVQDDVFAQDRQWWVGLKRKLYGLEQTYPTPFVCPTPKAGAPAPVVHEGTLVAAGLSADGVAKLDALLQTWAGDSDQAFAVCIVRHGVIALSKAYGQRDGRPMTITDKSWMASISKLLAGTLMMMAVDQGRVSLDDPVSKFLPAFRGVDKQHPLTVRHLYTHTGGLWGHWGDDLSDFDQVMGYYYPYLEVGQRYEYDGAGPAMGSKILEMATGEALPLFHKHHLLDPLGCTNTDVTTSSWDTQSTALDIAKIGQMLLNKGAYGNMRFFREDTFRQMLPDKVTRLVPTDTTTEYGMGTSWYSWEPLGKGTFGHGAASAATIRIDPVHDLVVAMTRNDAGRNFSTYHPKFLRAVVDALVDEK